MRERASLRYCEHGVLAPDLALGLDYENHVPPTRGRGIFLRRDGESVVAKRWFSRDPVRICKTPTQYLGLAARYQQIVTDRLHFAICGLIVGRDTTLLPNSYHKNRGMYETWLKPLGCRFAENVQEALTSHRREAA